jgi:hypothetical protein
VCHSGEVLQMVSEPLPSLRWGERAQAREGVASGHSLGRQEWANPMRVASEDVGS